MTEMQGTSNVGRRYDHDELFMSRPLQRLLPNVLNEYHCILYEAKGGVASGGRTPRFESRRTAAQALGSSCVPACGGCAATDQECFAHWPLGQRLTKPSDSCLPYLNGQAQSSTAQLAQTSGARKSLEAATCLQCDEIAKAPAELRSPSKNQ